jgi:hypothetical protein
MTFEEFKKEVNKDMYDITEIAYMAAEIEWDIDDLDSIPEATIKALSYLSSIEEAENIFKDFLKSKGIKTHD